MPTRLIIGENRRWRGASRHLRGRRLSDVTDRLAREVVDLIVQVEFERHSLKSHLRMAQLASGKRAVVEALVYGGPAWKDEQPAHVRLGSERSTRAR